MSNLDNITILRRDPPASWSDTNDDDEYTEWAVYSPVHDAFLAYDGAQRKVLWHDDWLNSAAMYTIDWVPGFARCSHAQMSINELHEQAKNEEIWVVNIDKYHLPEFNCALTFDQFIDLVDTIEVWEEIV